MTEEKITSKIYLEMVCNLCDAEIENYRISYKGNKTLITFECPYCKQKLEDSKCSQ